MQNEVIYTPWTVQGALSAERRVTGYAKQAAGLVAFVEAAKQAANDGDPETIAALVAYRAGGLRAFAKAHKAGTDVLAWAANRPAVDAIHGKAAATVEVAEAAALVISTDGTLAAGAAACGLELIRSKAARKAAMKANEALASLAYAAAEWDGLVASITAEAA